MRTHAVSFRDAWNLEEVYGKLLDFAKGDSFNPEAEDYLRGFMPATEMLMLEEFPKTAFQKRLQTAV